MYCCWNVLLVDEISRLRPTSKVGVIHRNVIKKVSSRG